MFAVLIVIDGAEIELAWNFRHLHDFASAKIRWDRCKEMDPKKTFALLYYFLNFRKCILLYVYLFVFDLPKKMFD